MPPSAASISGHAAAVWCSRALARASDAGFHSTENLPQHETPWDNSVALLCTHVMLVARAPLARQHTRLLSRANRCLSGVTGGYAACHDGLQPRTDIVDRRSPDVQQAEQAADGRADQRMRHASILEVRAQP